MIIPAHVDKSKIYKLIAPSGLHETFKGNPDCLLIFANLLIDSYLEEKKLLPSSVIHLENELNKTISYLEKQTKAKECLIGQIFIAHDNILEIELYYKSKPIRKNDPEKATEAMLIKRAKYEAARRCRKELEKKFSFLFN